MIAIKMKKIKCDVFRCNYSGQAIERQWTMDEHC